MPLFLLAEDYEKACDILENIADRPCITDAEDAVSLALLKYTEDLSQRLLNDPFTCDYDREAVARLVAVETRRCATEGEVPTIWLARLADRLTEG